MAGPKTQPDSERIAQWNAELRESSPQEILRWAVAQFGSRLTLACSFGGVSGMALLDMAVKIQPTLRVFYLDTEFLFPETYTVRDEAQEKYGIVPLVFKAKQTPAEQAATYGDRLWETDPDRCCALRKVEPNRRALEGMDAWIAGLRRDQSRTRDTIQPVQWDGQFGLYKLAPLWNWTEDDVWSYIAQQSVPVNALHAHGYTSIGCTHCTRPVTEGEDLRAGRWSGRGKTECGLHRQ